jgi:acyl-CoA reductase-like NAD-dependent aldehyde dehydrogenase
MTITESKKENELDAMLANRERAEEAIGPVADLSAFSDFAQALRTGNDRRYGPQTGVFTRDSAKAMRAWDKRNRRRP